MKYVDAHPVDHRRPVDRSSERSGSARDSGSSSGSGFMDGSTLGGDRRRPRRGRRSRSAGPRSGPAARPEPAGPGRLVEADRDRVPVACQRQAQESRVGEEPSHDAGLVQGQVAEALVPVRARRRIEEGGGAEALGEPLQLAGGDRALLQVDVMDDDPPFAEEAERGARRRPSRRDRRPGCRASSWSASCRAGRASRAAYRAVRTDRVPSRHTGGAA